MNLKKFLKAFLGRRKIKSQLLKADPVRIIFGAGGTNYVGWVSTDYPALDVTDQKSWASLFKFGQIDALLSEHVLEHLDDDQVVSAIENIHKYLKKGGYVRIAVPDGCHPNPEYIEAVKPGGSGLELLEWFDEQGAFNCIDWSAHDGMVTRSSRNDERNLIRPLSYTSLIVDAYKS
jgi:predicted SAM-dependent methyltransferase